MSLRELSAFLNQGHTADNFVLTSVGVRAKKGKFPVGYLLSEEQMQAKFPDRWLAVVDGVYNRGSILSTCLQGVVIAVFTCGEYVEHYSEYIGKCVFTRTYPVSKGVRMGTMV